MKPLFAVMMIGGLGLFFLEILMEVLGEIFLRLFFCLVGYAAGYIFVPILTLGLVYPGPKVSYKEVEADAEIEWWHATYCKNGERFMFAKVVAFCGWMVIAMPGVCLAIVIFC